MRNYYIFKLSHHFLYLYKNTPSKLYEIFKNIKNLNKTDYEVGAKIHNQVCNTININLLSEYIYNEHKGELSYEKKDYKHYNHNLYLNDISYMRIKRSHVYIQTNRNICEFMKDLNKYSDLFFVCDFENSDYFYLNKIKEQDLLKNR